VSHDGIVALQEVPGDLRGTAAQRLLWQCFKRVPRGKVQPFAAAGREFGVQRLLGECVIEGEEFPVLLSD
jgi:hypothetical protein